MFECHRYSSASEEAENKIPPLGEKFHRWIESLNDRLEALGLLEYITDLKYDQSSDEAQHTRRERCDMARVREIIRSSISDEDRERIYNMKNPMEMIKELERKYQGSGAKCDWELMVDFDNVKFEGTIEKTFTTIRHIYGRMFDQNIIIPRSFINQKVSSVIPPEFEEGRKILNMFNSCRPKEDHMSDRQFEDILLRIERSLPKNLSSSNHASLLSTNRDSRNNSNNYSSSNSNRNSSCCCNQNCKNQSNSSSNQNKSIKCRICGYYGHRDNQCRRQKKRDTEYDDDNDNCPNNNRNNNNRYNSNRSNNRFNNNRFNNRRSNNSDDVRDNSNNKQAVLFSLVGNANCSVFNQSTSRFLADSGASFHITNNYHALTNFKSYEIEIDTMNGVIKSVGSGDLECQLFNGTKWKIILFKINGFRSITNHKGLKIFHRNKIILMGSWSKEIKSVIELQIRTKKSISAIAKVDPTSLSLWHERCAHFSTSTIEKMFKENRVDGIPNLKNDVNFCTACHQGKLTDISHRNSIDDQHVYPGMKLHLDIGGYCDPSIHGNKYYLLALDHVSRYIKVAFMKSRDQVRYAIFRKKCYCNATVLPTNYKEAINSDDHHKWREAMNTEINHY
ncbi:hypothetical protein SSS_08112 [Sarcoptes scabiei]|uniref:GAG-pre-integrase domain-containing protein n=1 Tax=Sarcoptes scabiei TaxID=52283 RepID=A0A834RGA3_SARSC|nr:hypothetical protein SSS_08112 [Sarcoptes scabiei]